MILGATLNMGYLRRKRAKIATSVLLGELWRGGALTRANGGACAILLVSTAVLGMLFGGCASSGVQHEPVVIAAPTPVQEDVTPSDPPTVQEKPPVETPGEPDGSQPKTDLTAPVEGTDDSEPDPGLAPEPQPTPEVPDGTLTAEQEREVQRLMLQGQLQYKAGNLDGSRSLFEKALSLAPESSFVLLRLGRVYLDSDEPEKALELATRAADAEPENVDAQSLMVESWSSLGNYAEALQAAKQEVALNPKSVRGYRHVAELATQMGDREAAITALEKLAYLDMRDGSYWRLRLAGLLASDGRVEEAIEVYRQVLQQSPNHVETWRAVSELLERMGRVEEAIETYRQLLQKNLTEAEKREVHYKLAETLQKRGAYAEAYAEYQAVRDQIPDDPQSWYGQIELLVQQKLYEQAISEIKSYLSRYPFEVSLNVALFHPDCELALGNDEEAVRTLLKIIDAVTNNPKATALDYHLLGEKVLNPAYRKAAVSTGQDERMGELLLQAQATAPKSLLIPAALLMLERELKRETAKSANVAELARRLCVTPTDAADRVGNNIWVRETIMLLGLYSKTPDVLAETLLRQPEDPNNSGTWDFWFERLVHLLNDGTSAEKIRDLPTGDAVRARLQAFLEKKPDSLLTRLALVRTAPESARESAGVAFLRWLDELIGREETEQVEESVTTILSGDLLETFTDEVLTEPLLRTLSVAESKFPDNGLYGYAHGLVLTIAKRDMEAEAKFKQVAAKLSADVPWYASAKKRLAWIYDRQERYDEALEILLELQGLNDQDPDVFRHLAMLYDKMDRVEAMEEAGNRLILLTPEDAESHNLLGYLYALRDMKLDTALELVQRALELKPDDGNITDSLGWIYYRSGHYDRAAETLERARELTGEEHPVILDHLGDAYSKTGRIQQATPLWKMALEIGPNFPYEFTQEFQESVRKKILDAGEEIP